jgi:hypothetical protein
MLPWTVFMARSEAAGSREGDFEGLIGGTRAACVSGEVLVAEAHGANAEKGRNLAMELAPQSIATLINTRQAVPSARSRVPQSVRAVCGARSLHVRLKTIVSCCKHGAGTCPDRYTFVAGSLLTDQHSLLANHHSKGGTVNRPCTHVSLRKQTTARVQGRNVAVHAFAHFSASGVALQSSAPETLTVHRHANSMTHITELPLDSGGRSCNGSHRSGEGGHHVQRIS